MDRQFDLVPRTEKITLRPDVYGDFTEFKHRTVVIHDGHERRFTHAQILEIIGEARREKGRRLTHEEMLDVVKEKREEHYGNWEDI